MIHVKDDPDVVTFGEAMAMFVATAPGALHRVRDYRLALAGAEANVAVGLARLGHRVGWTGRVGADPLGRFLIEELASEGVDVSEVTADGSAPTGFQLKSMAQGGDPEVVYFRGNSAGSRLVASPASDSYLASARHLHVTGIPLALSSQSRDFAFHAVEVARAAGASVSFDPNLRPHLWTSPDEMVSVVNDMAGHCDWVMPGLSEGLMLTGASTASGIAASYLGAGAERVIVKDGSRGAWAFTAEGRWFRAVFPVEVVDTVGAGDGFAAGLISAHLDGLPLDAALERAAAVGALATTSHGDKDGLPTRGRLDAFIASMTCRPVLAESCAQA
ncbi:MAG: sugar kinase [Propionibacterium sp.]|nr:sugar kinase [Propionibacterium sp.]